MTTVAAVLTTEGQNMVELYDSIQNKPYYNVYKNPSPAYYSTVAPALLDTGASELNTEASDMADLYQNLKSAYINTGNL